MRDVVTLVLSGGGGERLGVLSTERAVSAIPFGGKYRIIDFVLSNCCHSGIDQVGVLTQHAPTSLHDHIGAGRPWDLDRRDHGVTVLQPYLTRGSGGWYRGTADAIRQNWDDVENLHRDRVLVLSGDHVYRMDYRALLAAHGLVASMSRTGNPYDNAAMESFYATLKIECLHRQELATRAEARAVTFDFIETFYNRGRLPSALGYKSPVDFENQTN